MVKFSHMADCHLGAFGRNPILREYNLKSFEKAIEISIERGVDFIIIAGDLFHNPHPDMDVVDRAVKSLMKARKNGLRIYSVYGSHDFNISKSSLIDVLESAGVFKKVVHYLDDENTLEHVKDKTGIHISGLSGRKNRMDASYYRQLDFKKPEGESIFVFHTPIAEMKPVDIHEEETVPLSSLPSGYNYYAGGHIHKKLLDSKDGAPVIYPSVTFGSSYTDLEKEIDRGFFIVDEWEPEYIEIHVCDIHKDIIKADGMKSSELEDVLLEKSGKKIDADVLLLKLTGKLAEGVPEDINFSNIRRRYEKNGVETVYLNRRNLEGKRSESIKIKEENEEEIEERVIEEYGYPDIITNRFAEDLLRILKVEQKEGETKNDYEDRIWTEVWDIVSNLDDYKKSEEEEVKEEDNNKEKREKKKNKVTEKGEENKKSQFSLSDFGGERQ